MGHEESFAGFGPVQVCRWWRVRILRTSRSFAAQAACVCVPWRRSREGRR